MYSEKKKDQYMPTHPVLERGRYSSSYYIEQKTFKRHIILS